MDIKDFLIKLGVALLSGIIIGTEREISKKNAGVRTNSLVALGAAIFVLVSENLIANGNGDPSRIIGQIVTGIGFLGAGVIIHRGVSTQGLTTAATIWCSAAIGCLAATGNLWEAIICALFVVFINFIFLLIGRFISKIKKKKQS